MTGGNQLTERGAVAVRADVPDATGLPWGLRREDLEEALARDAVVVDLQPQLDLCSGTIVALEALARWRPVEGREVPPLLMVPFAEANGLADALTSAVLRRALRCVGELDELGVHLGVSVNVSAHALADTGIVERVGDALRASGIAPR